MLPLIFAIHSCSSLLTQAISRIKKNVAYFRVNYCVGVALTCAASFLFHPTSLVVLGLLMLAWGYLLFVKHSPLVISGRQIRWVNSVRTSLRVHALAEVQSHSVTQTHANIHRPHFDL